MNKQDFMKLEMGKDNWNSRKITNDIIDLSGIILYRKDLTGYNFENVNLSKCSIIECNIDNCNFRRANLENSVIQYTQSAKFVDMSYAKFYNTHLLYIDFISSKFFNGFEFINFECCTFKNCYIISNKDNIPINKTPMKIYFNTDEDFIFLDKHMIINSDCYSFEEWKDILKDDKQFRKKFPPNTSKFEILSRYGDILISIFKKRREEIEEKGEKESEYRASRNTQVRG